MHSRRHSRRLRIASYNVHSWIGRDRRRELDADLVALQEARHDRAEELLDRPLAGLCGEAGYELIEGPTRLHEESTFGNVLLSQIPISKLSRIDLTVARREPRGALSAEIDRGGLTVQIVATHLGLRARERESQVSKLLDWIGSGVAETGPDVVSLLGDFNEWRPRAAALRRIESAFGRSAAPRTFPAWSPWLRLDRIWVLPRSTMRGSAHVHRSAKARLASDHLPVVADLQLPRRAGSRLPSEEADEADHAFE